MKKEQHLDPKKGEIISRIVFSESKSNLKRERSKPFPMFLEGNWNSIKLVQAARNGLTYESLRYAQEIMPFSIKEWASILHVSVRTLDRLKKDGSKLNLSLSDKLIQIALLFDYGTDVFGTLEKFSKWLGRTNIALGAIEPKLLLDTNQGIIAIRTSLSRIEHGIPV